MPPVSYARHQFPTEVIGHAVWLYLCFTLSYRDVEDLLAERELDISYETVRRWVLKFGPAIAQRLRRHRPKPSPRRHLDEMAVRIACKQMFLWRAVDDDGEVLDVLVQRRRNKAAACKQIASCSRSTARRPRRSSLTSCDSTAPPALVHPACGFHQDGLGSTPQGSIVAMAAGRNRGRRRGRARYAVRDWAAYDRALARRGDITVWVSPDAVAAWRAPAGRRTFSDAAIAAALTVRAVYRLALRQAEGLVASIFALLRLALPVPDHTTLSRRGRVLRLERHTSAGRGIDFAIDSTGLRLARPPGAGCEGWRKLHIAVDPDSGCILAEELTRSEVHDTVPVPAMLARTEGRLGRVYGDGAHAGGRRTAPSPSAGRRCRTPRAFSGRRRRTCAPQTDLTHWLDGGATRSTSHAMGGQPGSGLPATVDAMRRSGPSRGSNARSDEGCDRAASMHSGAKRRLPCSR